MPGLSGRLASILVIACVLVGCQRAAPEPTPAPPTFQCTPEAGGPEFECTEYEHRDMAAKDRLYAEAEAAYRKFFAEHVRILRAGGITKATQALLDTTMGDFHRDSMALYRSFVREGIKSVGGEIRLTSLSRVPEASQPGLLIALRACVDASTRIIHRSGKSARKGKVGADLLFFSVGGGALKIQRADRTSVQKC